MRRRGCADPSPQRHSKAVRRPTQRSVPGAQSPTPDPSATCSSSVSASSQQIVASQPSKYPPSALERVGRDVRVLILQCLNGRHKLTAVCRLSRTFRELPALAFHYDCIAALLQGAAEVHRAVRTATGRLSWLNLWVTQAEEAGRWTLFTCPRSLRSLPHMSALKTLQITVPLHDIPEKTALLRCILRSVLSLPSLTSLDILVFRQPSGCYRVPELVWTDDALPSPVSLRHLTLRHVSLSAACFRRVCCLPLESLTVLYCTVQAGDDTALVSTAQPSACTLTKLVHFGSPSCGVVSAIGSYALQLRELCFRYCDDDLPSGPAWDFSSLMIESGGPRLPHLTKLSLPTISLLVSTDDWQQEPACTAASQRLVAAYSAQLTSLRLTVVAVTSVSSWFRLLFRLCDRLDELTIEGRMVWARPDHSLESQLQPAEAGEKLTLPRLRSLTLERLPLDDSDLQSVLSRCPELEKCSLAG